MAARWPWAIVPEFLCVGLRSLEYRMGGESHYPQRPVPFGQRLQRAYFRCLSCIYGPIVSARGNSEDTADQRALSLSSKASRVPSPNSGVSTPSYSMPLYVTVIWYDSLYYSKIRFVNNKTCLIPNLKKILYNAPTVRNNRITRFNM